ncbi:hypothetical protein PSE_3126 [Pseudovibrio sp. FO-BEG1]|nr:hypothetical protein PSE_3126 [Pseudovibrio sp. FO-BEG1]
MKRGFASHGLFWLGKRDASQAFLMFASSRYALYQRH